MVLILFGVYLFRYYFSIYWNEIWRHTFVTERISHTWGISNVAPLLGDDVAPLLGDADVWIKVTLFAGGRWALAIRAWIFVQLLEKPLSDRRQKISRMRLCCIWKVLFICGLLCQLRPRKFVSDGKQLLLQIARVYHIASLSIFDLLAKRQSRKLASLWCCNLSGGVALNVWFTTNGICVKNSTIHTVYVARTSNNRVIMACEFNCCLLPQCEALRTCRSGFPIATLNVGTALVSHCLLLPVACRVG